MGLVEPFQVLEPKGKSPFRFISFVTFIFNLFLTCRLIGYPLRNPGFALQTTCLVIFPGFLFITALFLFLSRMCLYMNFRFHTFL